MASDEMAMIGKLHHKLMVSQWNEGQVNKKYESTLERYQEYKHDAARHEVQVDRY